MLAQLLGQVAVQCCRSEATRFKALGQLKTGSLGAHEDNHGFNRLDFEQAGHGVQFVVVGDFPDFLGNGLETAAGATVQADFGRLFHVVARDIAHTRRHGCGEQCLLGGVWNRFKDRFQIVGEAHLEHLVGFVECQVAQLLQLQASAAQVIGQSARRGDNNMRAALKCLELGGESRAAIQGENGKAAHVLGVALERLCNLQSELAGWGQNQRLSGAQADINASEYGQREGCSLAGTGLCQTEQILAGQKRRDGFSLDRGGSFVAKAVESLEEMSGQAEIGKLPGRSGFGHTGSEP